MGSGRLGIIPARAGFTRVQVVGHQRPKDHPRSRGVYHSRRPSSRRARGSSPLARGLLTSGRTRETIRGIIPARAGFTDHRGDDEPSVKDHPRSRGVYDRTTSPRLKPPGSSPLARGLRSWSFPLVISLRIIPARAGFTGGRRTTATIQCGSSPLARGLPAVRATGHFERVDHPRSRGVYPWGPARGRRTGGSSPLARGLLVRSCAAVRFSGIIPARAGFTRSRGRWKAARADHPRSRGVYRPTTP